MKQRITLSIALVMSIVLLSLMGSASPANAAPPRKYVADTGVITLGPNQLLRITVAPRQTAREVNFNFGLIKYYDNRQDNSGVSIHSILSQTTTDPLTISRGEAVSMDIRQTPDSSGVRVLVYLNSSDVEVNTDVADVITGATSASGHVKVFDGSSGGYLLF